VRLGNWNMVNVKFNMAANLKKWSYLLVSIPPWRDAFNEEGLTALIERFHHTLMDIGIIADRPLKGQRIILNDHDDSQLDNILARAAKSLDLLFIILPAPNVPQYNQIKHCGDVKYGIHT